MPSTHLSLHYHIVFGTKITSPGTCMLFRVAIESGSARASRAGDGAIAIADFSPEIFAASH
ncbi:MAG: hypothetical protein DME45_12310 [Verrucomicrobia bacterium]|nr:MAG: hypothetical protein DME45_12310 [Verrucomicrobiota bacterium]PYL02634.1 MAG: hypothetical protein DME32_05960 [Verrucomicrobiota bacterium]